MSPFKWLFVVPGSVLVVLALLLSMLPVATGTVHAAGGLRVTPQIAGPGDTVGITGYGFQPGETVTLTADFHVQGNTDRVQTVAQAGSAGSFAVQLHIPDHASPAPYRIVASGSRGNRATTPLYVVPVVTVQPGASTPAITAVAGHRFLVRGTGFQGGETVKLTATFPLYSGNSTTENRTVATNGKGQFGETVLTVPANARAQSVTLTAAGQTSKKQARATVSVVYQPAISAGNAAPGGRVPVSGSGFAPNMRVRVSLTIRTTSGSTETVSQTVQAGSNGNISASLQLPANIKPGSYTVTATGTASGASASAAVQVGVHPVIIVNPTTVLPGQTVAVSGSGFTPNATVTVHATVPLYGGGSQSVGTTVTTNGSGSFSTTVTLPGRAAAGTVTLTARGPNGQTGAHLTVKHLTAAIAVVPQSVIPGGTVVVRGSGYLRSDTVDVSLTLTLKNGSQQTLRATATTDAYGRFSETFHIPTAASGGTYTVRAASRGTGRAPTARLVVAGLQPSVVVVPSSAMPGTSVTIKGFGFAAGQNLTVTIAGQTAGTVTTNGQGTFSLTATVPSGLASGSYAVTATSAAGRHATVTLAVNRAFSTHYYFAGFYTGQGYHEYLALLNPSNTRARVTITYQTTTGRIVTKNVTLNAHTRATEDVNADLGVHVSSGAVVSADVPVAVERVMYHGYDGATVPGATSPSTSWYFADGNTAHGYHEYLAIANPSNGAVQAAIHFFPAHHRAFTLYRTVGAHSRRTVKVNSFVNRDAVGVAVTSNGAVVVNRSIFIHHGTTSKIGVKAGQRTWYFAAGPTNSGARYWIAATNPFNRWSYVTVRAYGPYGSLLGQQSRWMKPYARAGYLINSIAHRTDVAVEIIASQPIVAEQTTYLGKMHSGATNTFGSTGPMSNWTFAAVNTTSGHADHLALFNPTLVTMPIVVQFMTSGGQVIERTYTVGPMATQRIDVGSIAPSVTLGVVATSNTGFVALNRAVFANGTGAMTSTGEHL